MATFRFCSRMAMRLLENGLNSRGSDATAVDACKNPRSVYSRADYAAYNASQAVRYVVRGFVSLRGHDHKKVADLPSNFPDVDSWVAKVRKKLHRGAAQPREIESLKRPVVHHPAQCGILSPNQ